MELVSRKIQKQQSSAQHGLLAHKIIGTKGLRFDHLSRWGFFARSSPGLRHLFWSRIIDYPKRTAKRQQRAPAKYDRARGNDGSLIFGGIPGGINRFALLDAAIATLKSHVQVHP